MNYAILSILIVLCGACAYRGVFGAMIYRWCRYPFAYLGIACLSIAGVPLYIPPQEEFQEQAQEQPMEVETPSEPGDPDNGKHKQLFSLKGLTPTDVMNACVPQAQGRSQSDPEFDEVEWLQEKESTRDWVQRKQLERAAS